LKEKGMRHDPVVESTESDRKWDGSENSRNVLHDTPAVFAKRREAIEKEGVALRSFAARCKNHERVKRRTWGAGELEVQPGGGA
jgi:hypothetical protein